MKDRERLETQVRELQAKLSTSEERIQELEQELNALTQPKQTTQSEPQPEPQPTQKDTPQPTHKAHPKHSKQPKQSTQPERPKQTKPTQETPRQQPPRDPKIDAEVNEMMSGLYANMGWMDDDSLTAYVNIKQGQHSPEVQQAIDSIRRKQNEQNDGFSR